MAVKRRTGRLRGSEVGPLGHKQRRLLNDCGAERFDQNELRKLRADGQSRIADLADEIGLAGQQLDNLIFAQPQFPQAVLDFRRRAKLLDAHRDARLDPAQGTDLATGLIPDR